MATHIISTSVSFVRKHPFTLCCLALLFIPPVYRLLLFFTPLLASTALCVLALVSWVPNQGGPNMSDKKLNRLFDDTKEDKRDNKRAADVSMCYREYERSAETSDEPHWMDSNLLAGSSENYHESLEERWRLQEADDGEQLINAYELVENSAEARSDERELQAADTLLQSPNSRPDFAGDDIGGLMSVEADREVPQIRRCSSERVNGGGEIQEAQARRMSEREGDHEKVIAKLKMAMEREVAALEASLMAPQMPTTELGMHCREEEHHHLIFPTKHPYSLQGSASC